MPRKYKNRTKPVIPKHVLKKRIESLKKRMDKKVSTSDNYAFLEIQINNHSCTKTDCFFCDISNQINRGIKSNFSSDFKWLLK
jgi:histone acetyltransferase (RNA polymerase elongator complex component)